MNQLETLVRETGPDPQWSVIWLHGLGADGGDFAPIVPELVSPEWPAVRFVFPHAPERPVTINGGMRMRAWYDIRDMDLVSRADAEGVAESVAQVGELIEREIGRGSPASRIVLAGFSQGGAIALNAAAQRTIPLAGVIALSTYLPRGATTFASTTDAARTQPIFMAHGRHDPVVPYAAGEQSCAALRAAGFVVDWHAYPMPHAVCADEIADLASWLGKRWEVTRV